MSTSPLELGNESPALILSAHRFDVGRRRARPFPTSIGNPDAYINATLVSITSNSSGTVQEKPIAFGSEDPLNTTGDQFTPDRHHSMLLMGGRPDKLQERELGSAGIEIVWLTEGDDSYVAVQRKAGEGEQSTPILEYQGIIPKTPHR